MLDRYHDATVLPLDDPVKYSIVSTLITQLMLDRYHDATVLPLDDPVMKRLYQKHMQFACVFVLVYFDIAID